MDLEAGCPARLGANSTAGIAVPGASGRRGVLLVFLAALGLQTTLAWMADVDLIDDSYILLRYARNFHEGQGLVFNAGERVEGFTSFLWTVMLAGAGALGIDLELAAKGMGLLLGAGLVVILTWPALRGRREGDWAGAILLAGGMSLSPMVFFWSASGMDAMLFAFLSAGVWVCALQDRGRGRISGRTAGMLMLATLARPEGVLLAGFVGGWFLLERRSVCVLAVYAVCVGAMLVARYVYYGDWAPNTYYAKVAFGLPRRIGDGIAYVKPALSCNGPLLGATGLVLALAMRKPGAHRAPLLGLATWVASWMGYVIYIGGDNFPVHRFLLPVVPALVLAGWLAWTEVRTALPPTRVRALAVMLVGAMILSHWMTALRETPRYHGDVLLARAWRDVGRWIDEYTPPATVVATPVPGAMGYFGKRTTIDMLGLTDRRIGSQGNVYAEGGHGHARYDTDYLFNRAPDVVVYHSSGRFSAPVYARPEAIHRFSSYALYDFVTDPRCGEQYEYATAALPGGKLLEMQVRRGGSLSPAMLAARTSGVAGEIR